jgi:DNA-binding protein
MQNISRIGNWPDANSKIKSSRFKYPKVFTIHMSEPQSQQPQSQQPQSQQPQSQQNQQFFRDAPRDAIYIGKKPLMAYVTSTLIQLANQPIVTIKARGLSIGRAVDVSQIILKRMENAGYKVGEVRIGSETVQSEDGRTRNVSTIEIEIRRSS